MLGLVPVNSAMSIVMVYTTIYNLTNGELSRRGTVAPNEVLSQKIYFRDAPCDFLSDCCVVYSYAAPNVVCTWT